MLDKPAPDFDLAAVPGLDKPGLATADPAGGGVVMVNFFASWCVPCRAAHPFISAMTEETGVPLSEIHHSDKPEAAAAWLAEPGHPYRRNLACHCRAPADWGATGQAHTVPLPGNG